MNTYYTYILANQPRGTLYIGVTNNLLRRMVEYREGVADGFTKKYNITTQLMHLEAGESIEGAIVQEKRWKNWRRAWKVNLIEKHNLQ